MKVCQIATVGENIEWILKGLLIFKADKLILISTSDPDFIKKTDEIKDRLSDPNFEIKLLEIDVKIIETEDPIEFINLFKGVILENYEQGYRVEINATAGLRVWQILGYFTKIQLNKIVKKYFIINKRSGEPIIFPPYIISKTEQIILDLIGKEKKNIEQIKQSYEIFKGKSFSPTLISKYLTKLKEKNLILESKVQNIKFFQLSNLGMIYRIDSSIYSLIEN